VQSGARTKPQQQAVARAGSPRDPQQAQSRSDHRQQSLDSSWFDHAKGFRAGCQVHGPWFVEKSTSSTFAAARPVSPPSTGGPPRIGHPEIGSGNQAAEPALLADHGPMIRGKSGRRYPEGVIEHQLGETIADRLEVERTDVSPSWPPSNRFRPGTTGEVRAAQKAEGPENRRPGKKSLNQDNNRRRQVRRSHR